VRNRADVTSHFLMADRSPDTGFGIVDAAGNFGSCGDRGLPRAAHDELAPDARLGPDLDFFRSHFGIADDDASMRAWPPDACR